MERVWVIEGSAKPNLILKKTININDVDINKIVISKKVPYGKKRYMLDTLSAMMIMIILDHYP